MREVNSIDTLAYCILKRKYLEVFIYASRDTSELESSVC